MQKNDAFVPSNFTKTESKVKLLRFFSVVTNPRRSNCMIKRRLEPISTDMTKPVFFFKENDHKY